MLDDMVNNTSVRSQSHMRMPLNSLRITAGQLSRLDKVLGLTSSGSIDDQRLMVEGKISEMSHEPYNVQVVFEEYFSDASFQLCDEGGEFVTVSSADANYSYKGDEPYQETASGSFEEQNEVQLLHQSVTDITRERDKLRKELEATRQQLKLKKARVKELWRMSCEQVEEHDALIISKDEEIARLKAQLAERVRQRSPTSPDAESLLVSDVAQPREARHG